ncbi:hypothetical protein PAMA_006755 [Pampus argenteus]
MKRLRLVLLAALLWQCCQAQQRGVSLTTSATIAELNVWPQFVCLATPSLLVSGGLIVLFQLKSLQLKITVYPQRTH